MFDRSIRYMMDEEDYGQYEAMPRGRQTIPEIPAKSIELPQPNLITHTIQLHAYSRLLSALLEQPPNTVFDPLSFPSSPRHPSFDAPEKKFNDVSLGRCSVILPFTAESHKRAIRQCATIAIGHVGIPTCTNTALTALADSLDVHITNLCQLMRTVADSEASGLKSGLLDILSKVFTELNVGNLHDFYQNRVVKYHAKISRKCEYLSDQCEEFAMAKLTSQIKLEVPELHRPVVLDGAFTPSSEPEPKQLELLDTVSTETLKIETMEFSQP